MNTQELQELFSAHLDGFLSPQEEEALAQYLKDNPASLKELEELKFLSQSFQGLPEEDLPQGFKAELHKKLAELALAKANKKRLRQRPWLKGVAVFAALILVIGFAGSNLAGRFLAAAGLMSYNASYDASPAEYFNEMAVNDYASTEGYSAGGGRIDFAESPINEDAYLQEKGMGEAPKSAPPANIERRIIRNAYLSVETGDYKSSHSAIITLAAKYGGYVVSSYTNNNADGSPNQGNISIRVDSAKLEEALDEIRELGKILNENISSNDITAQYYDIITRLNQYQAQKDRLTELYAKAENISELIQIEGELSRINTEIDLLEGQLRYYTELTDLSGIDVNLTVPREFREKFNFQGWHGLGRKISVALMRGVNFVLNITSRALLFITAVLPALLILFLIFLLLRFIIKRRAKNK